MPHSWKVQGFTKDFLARHNIPTAAYGNFTDLDDALAYLKQVGVPIVVKADGLAAGKGVIIAHDMETAEETIRDMLSGNSFGEAGHRVVIEEFLTGEEASFIVMADGRHILPMASSQDHKAAEDGDAGPNTGGMGAYSPAPVVTPAMHDRIMDEVILPTVSGMAQEGLPYTGFLYAGVIINNEGVPKVLEFNCRFGDPETQPIMLRMKSDLVTPPGSRQRHPGYPAGRLGSAGIPGRGYCRWRLPGSYQTGDVISGIPKQTLTPRYFTLAPPRKTARWSLREDGYYAPPRWVIPSQRPSNGPMHWCGKSAGMASTTEMTSATGPSLANKPDAACQPMQCRRRQAGAGSGAADHHRHGAHPNAR